MFLFVRKIANYELVDRIRLIEVYNQRFGINGQRQGILVPTAALRGQSNSVGESSPSYERNEGMHCSLLTRY